MGITAAFQDGKFSLGSLGATTNLVNTLHGMYGVEGANLMLLLMLRRHHAGDWGDCCTEDAKANEDALKFGDRILSIYHPEPDVKIYIITEWDRSSTMLMLAEDY